MSYLARKKNRAQGAPPGGPRGKSTPVIASSTKALMNPKTAWEYYNEGMEVIDREREKEWLEQMDTILIFAALFAGFLSAFLIELLGRLEPDPMYIIQDVMIHQTQMMRNSSLGPYVPADFSPPDYIVVVNALFYASLGVMLLAAFIAMLIKSWVREFDRGLAAISIPEQRAKTREFRYLGMEHWKLQEMVAMLPFLVQISLLLFAIGLIQFLFHISKPSFGVTTAIFGVGVLYYAITTAISVFVTSSPFHSPLSRTFGKVHQHVHGYFCPVLDDFLSPNMDSAPVTAFGRLRRRIQIFLQKSRPYLERDFVEPIASTTVDEVQLSTTASALQRIHDSVPNSRHSELIQRSVWQVAGSPALRMRPLIKLPSWILDRSNGKEYFSQLSPASVVALTAVFIRMRDPRYKNRIVAVGDIPRAVNDSQGPWDQLVPAIFDLLPNKFAEDAPLHDARLRRALRLDTLLRDALSDAPSIDALRNSLLRDSLRDIVDGPKTYAVFLQAMSRNIRTGLINTRSGLLYTLLSNHPLLIDVISNHALVGALRDALRDAPLRLIRAILHDALLGNAVFDDMACQGRITRVYLAPEEPVGLINILQANQLQEAESIWLLNTLSGLHCDGLIMMRHHVSKICLAILLHQAPKWNRMTPPNIMLIEAVVTLGAISCSSNETYQTRSLTNSHRHPWLLLNLRNTDLISRIITEIHDSSREELISLLFLVIHALILRGSETLAGRYLAIITAKADFVFCASALSVIAPVLGDEGFRAIGELLLAPQTQFLTPTARGSSLGGLSDFPHLRLSHQILFNNYDLQLGATEFPNPKIFTILLLLSKDLSGDVRQQLWDLDLELRNPWLQLIAKVISQRDISDVPCMDMWSFHDHRVHNMFAALSQLRYSDKNGNYRIPWRSLSLASFLESKEPVICCAVLYYYVEMVNSNVPPPACYFSDAVLVTFNPILPNHHLSKGWDILHGFVYWYEQLSVDWRQTFAEAFFTLSRRRLLRENRLNDTPSSELELKEILTWEYFCEEEGEPELTGADLCGLDWMAMAWSLHLSQQSGTRATVQKQREAQPLNFKELRLNEHFVFRVLCNLLDAAPYHSIVPIIPKLREFVAWFNDPELFEYKSMISSRIVEALNTLQESKALYKFQKFHCMWTF